MVLRNHIGTILYCVMTIVEDVESPLHVEFLAILFGLEVCKNNDFISLHSESDSLLAIREIEAGLGSFNEWRGIISDALSFTMHYNFSSFCHISRTRNECVHNLTKISCNLREYKVWQNSLPLSFCNLNSIEV